ncbi:hypothetical protein [Cupriavidus pampae]|uniref:Uncharacterized protein n=1 Tax=Cupriavidus pampae TaxID=659251 RepID=A0ABN7ZFP5_9BURK|nr:hypothetical protein [Cupriavidus pampae]CAG9184013.1 hypothetical protein LMG32289_05486 [Cupriavidus pampae]
MGIAGPPSVVVPLRDGHRLRLYYALANPAEPGTLVATRNLCTGETVDTLNMFQPLPAPAFWRRSWLRARLTPVVAVILCVVFGLLAGTLLARVGVCGAARPWCWRASGCMGGSWCSPSDSMGLYGHSGAMR